MPDIRELMNSPYLGHWDLMHDGKAMTVRLVIEKGCEELVEMGEGRKGKKWVLYFRTYRNPRTGRTRQVKPMILNATNLQAIATWYGTKTEAWDGKEIIVTVGEAKAPPKWKPVYGDRMPSLAVRGKPRGEALVQKLQAEAKDEPGPDMFEDASEDHPSAPPEEGQRGE